MNKVLLSIAAAAALFAGAAHAGDYVGVDFQNKDKAYVAEYHDVYGAYYGHTIDQGQYKGVTIEGRIEDEVVTSPAKQEGLFQVKAAYAPDYNFYGVRPYVAAAVGYKSKATIDFPYYVAEVGAKYTVPVYFQNKLELKLATRLRSPFDEGTYHSGPDRYRTVETSVGAGYKVTAHDTVFVKSALETGDSHYETWGVGVTHSF